MLASAAAGSCARSLFYVLLRSLVIKKFAYISLILCPKLVKYGEHNP